MQSMADRECAATLQGKQRGDTSVASAILAGNAAILQDNALNL